MFCVSISLPMRKSLRAKAVTAARAQNQTQSEAARIWKDPRGWRPILLRDLGDNPRADRAASFADREAKARVHGDRGDQLDAQIHVVSRHHHLSALRELHLAGDVGRPEVE